MLHGLTTFMNTVPDIDITAREKLERFQDEVAKIPQYDFPVKHYFVDGLYVREIFIPAGYVLVGYIHMYPCITTVSKGRIVISDGDKSTVITAPFTVAVPPGTKKAGYALEDTVWSDAYVNTDNERDIEKLEERLTANSHQHFLEKTKRRFLT